MSYDGYGKSNEGMEKFEFSYYEADAVNSAYMNLRAKC